MRMQFPATKRALTWCGAYAVMGAVVQSSHMAAGGVFALLVWTPFALVSDWLLYRKLVRQVMRILSARPSPQLLLSPPERTS